MTHCKNNSEKNNDKCDCTIWKLDRVAVYDSKVDGNFAFRKAF